MVSEINKDIMRQTEVGPEQISDYDIEQMVLTTLDASELKDSFRKLVKKIEGNLGKFPEFNLIFIIEDLGENDGDKKRKLRFLKAMLEDSFYNKYIKSITVKGDSSTKNIEPNVFASDVKFVEI